MTLDVANSTFDWLLYSIYQLVIFASLVAIGGFIFLTQSYAEKVKKEEVPVIQPAKKSKQLSIQEENEEDEETEEADQDLKPINLSGKKILKLDNNQNQSQHPSDPESDADKELLVLEAPNNSQNGSTNQKTKQVQQARKVVALYSNIEEQERKILKNRNSNPIDFEQKMNGRDRSPDDEEMMENAMIVDQMQQIVLIKPTPIRQLPKKIVEESSEEEEEDDDDDYVHMSASKTAPKFSTPSTGSTRKIVSEVTMQKIPAVIPATKPSAKPQQQSPVPPPATQPNAANYSELAKHQARRILGTAIDVKQSTKLVTTAHQSANSVYTPAATIPSAHTIPIIEYPPSPPPINPRKTAASATNHQSAPPTMLAFGVAQQSRD